MYTAKFESQSNGMIKIPSSSGISNLTLLKASERRKIINEFKYKLLEDYITSRVNDTTTGSLTMIISKVSIERAIGNILTNNDLNYIKGWLEANEYIVGILDNDIIVKDPTETDN